MAGVDDEELVERITIDIPKRDAEFLMQLAAFSNAMADVEGKALRRKWTRKTIVEALVRNALKKHRDEIQAAAEPDDQ